MQSKAFDRSKKGHSNTFMVVQVTVPLMESSYKRIRGGGSWKETKLSFSEDVINKQVLENLAMNNFFEELAAYWLQGNRPVVRGRLRIPRFENRDHPGELPSFRNLTGGEAQVENITKNR